MHQTTFDEDCATATIERPKKPRLWKVILLNDDETPFDFVIAILMRFFGKTQDEASALALKIHNEGAGVAGIYVHEIAETKALQTTTTARSHGYPLAARIEEDEE